MWFFLPFFRIESYSSISRYLFFLKFIPILNMVSPFKEINTGFFCIDIMLCYMQSILSACHSDTLKNCIQSPIFHLYRATFHGFTSEWIPVFGIFHHLSLHFSILNLFVINIDKKSWKTSKLPNSLAVSSIPLISGEIQHGILQGTQKCAGLGPIFTCPGIFT